ncbi:DUF2075 domain-containing protein [Nocardia uniformis]|uniref:DUF2075 domain-containing protein n=2 Tax=Nocardia uniformis TaxID=53432 RepID=A0A849C0P8_9NOCA|nr:DNA/RNA helicase domain-containing protein [Nocardia uniformis]NNH72312.1 DUF2075 domain-containing protein [Nocardia uniformis]
MSAQALLQWEQKVGTSELASWKHSLLEFLHDLVGGGLGDIEVLLEQQLPNSPKRMDAVLCGVHPQTGALSYVVVELKQWSRVEAATEKLVSIRGYADAILHPVEQVRWYCQYLVDMTPDLVGLPNSVHGIAYLHNALSADVEVLNQCEETGFGRLFTGDSKSEMLEYLRTLLDPSGGRGLAHDAANRLLNFRHAPTKPLLQLAAAEIRGRQQFMLLDEQRVAYELVMGAVERARTKRTKTVVVVLGGPGSGKSVIALSLLGDLACRGLTINHATGSRAFTKTMRKVAAAGSARAESIFKYFYDYKKSAPGELDVLICDEAHRIRNDSDYWRPGPDEPWKRRRQIDQLIDVAWVPIFLLDEQQLVRPREMGSLAEIKAAAQAAGCKVRVVRLDGQFRCGGSDLYEVWVRRLLQLDPRPPVSWSQLTADVDDGFVVSNASSPAALEAWTNHKHEHESGSARMAAGFCWEWSDPVGRGDQKRLVGDVRIDDWSRPWNAKPDKHVPGVPDADYWASDERGVGQVGCIYTAQGFEYDWAGVIFGPDLVRRSNRWVARREPSWDSQVKEAAESDYGALIRNTYKVLLTRGMKGTCVYSTDSETQEFLEEMAR